jgi:hypothetical protein
MTDAKLNQNAECVLGAIQISRPSGMKGRSCDSMYLTMEEITFQVQRDEESGALVAWWDDPAGGGITTQGDDLSDLQKQVTDAVACHFDEGAAPQRIRIHFVSDPILVQT